MKNFYDAIVIGSGFGGSITADRLVSEDIKTALLERGPWRKTRPVLGAGITDASPLPQHRYFYSHMLRNAQFSSDRKISMPNMIVNRNGMYEIFYSNKTFVACASGVGGGSHAYTALHHKPKDPKYWHHISEQLNPKDMEFYYKQFLTRMDSQLAPNSKEIPNQTKHLYKNHPVLTVDQNTWRPHMGVLFSNNKKTHSNRSVSKYCNEGLLGSYSGSKTTLDTAYLLNAVEQGLSIWDCTEAYTLSVNPKDSAKRYRVDCYNHKTKRYHTLQADFIFLGAGTLNTLKLLFRSRQNQMLSGLTQLGNQFATNADAIAFWALQNNTIDYTQGLPCHGPVSFVSDASNQETETETAQYIQAGISGLDQIPLPQRLRNKMRGNVFLIGMGEDHNNGKVRWNKNRLSIHYSLKEQQIYRSIQNNFERLQQHSNKPLFYLKSTAATVHPLGGAPIHDDPSQGLISGIGEIHNYPGLFITDATALPKSPGMPPSMTIAAWSSHVANSFIQSQGTATNIEEPKHEICH